MSIPQSKGKEVTVHSVKIFTSVPERLKKFIA